MRFLIFPMFLTAILAAIKISGVENIPTIWVLAPLWIPMVTLFLFACVFATKVVEAIKKTREGAIQDQIDSLMKDIGEN